MDKISVIVPIYNREKYIAACLDSILGQTHKNLEVLCVDDCSKDSSLAIVTSYAERDSRVKVIALSPNGGVSNARNQGLANATGEWVAFVDSDDTIEPTMLEDLLRVALEKNVDVVLSDLDMLSGGKKQDMKISLEPLRVYKKEEIYRDILPRFTYDGKDNLGLFAFSTKLYRRSIIERAKLSFDVKISYEEDKLFVIAYLANCNSLCYLPHAYYKYDTSSGGLYSSFNPVAWNWYVASYRKFKSLIETYKIPNTNPAYLGNSFIYTLTWFLFRSKRIPDKKERKRLQKEVLEGRDVRAICEEILPSLTSFDYRMARAIVKGQRAYALFLIDFVYSGKKDKLLARLGRS